MTDDTLAPIPTPDPTAWFAQEQDYVKRCDSVRPANKTALFDAFVGAGITTVVVTFDGCGDSGQIEDVTAKAGDHYANLPSLDVEIARADWDSVEIARVTLPIRDVIEELAYDLLRQTHCGWENNDGAYGEFTFDVTERTITLDYNERCMSSENYTHQF
ncbi:MAG: DUF6878 family protein [Afipia sp.]